MNICAAQEFGAPNEAVWSKEIPLNSGVASQEPEDSVLKSQVQEQLIHQPDPGGGIVEKFSDSLTGNQGGHAEHHDHVVADQGAVFKAGADVGADEAIDFAREEELFQRGRAIEEEEVDVVDHLEFRGNVEVDAGVVEEETGVDEVGLALDLTGTKVGNQAPAVDEVDAEEREILALPIAELPAGELLTASQKAVENRVEAGRGAVVGVMVAGRVKEAGAKSNPVSIV